MPELHEVAFVASERKSFGSEKETAKQEPPLSWQKKEALLRRVSASTAKPGTLRDA